MSNHHEYCDTDLHISSFFLLTLTPSSSPSSSHSAPFSIVLFPPLPSSVCQLSTIAKDSQSVEDRLLSSVRVCFDVSSSLWRYYFWLMWKRLTVHSVLRFLFVSQWCTLRSCAAAKQPSATEPVMTPALCRSQKLLHLHFFPTKLCWLMCLSPPNCSSVTVMKFEENKH